MTRKDWKLGECRVQIEIITPSGSGLKYYIPHLNREMCQKAVEFASEAIKSQRVYGRDWDAFYVTTFCNQAHRLRDGKPINHECYILPVEMLLAEADGRLSEAQDLLARFGKGSIHKGVKG